MNDADPLRALQAPDASELAREIMTGTWNSARAAMSAFRLLGTQGGADGSVTLELAMVDPNDPRTFTVTVAHSA